ncbi:MAG: putative RecB family exonuclease [Mycobacterium sp.]|jgi:putative RecB family exonuclease|nr:putative RecB family exonuclease [Mycobacterium sp.]
MAAPQAEVHSARPALSPSRAADFKQCPLLYRFRAIDRLPEAPSTAQLRGSVVHAALERLYGLPAVQRGPDTARSLVDDVWDQVIASERGLVGELDPDQRTQLLDDARALLSGYYRLEDPTRFDPQGCEQRVEVELADGTLLRGYIDRIDVAATGELRVVDYKTGKAPPEARALAEFKAMFQMKFYAVALLRSRDVLPARLRLIYLADGQVLDYSPEREELLRFEKTLMAIWRAIQSAGQTGDFRPRPSRLCDWCSYQALCPAFGGTPPPYPGWPQDARSQSAVHPPQPAA